MRVQSDVCNSSGSTSDLFDNSGCTSGITQERIEIYGLASNSHCPCRKDSEQETFKENDVALRIVITRHEWHDLITVSQLCESSRDRLKPKGYQVLHYLLSASVQERARRCCILTDCWYDNDVVGINSLRSTCQRDDLRITRDDSSSITRRKIVSYTIDGYTFNSFS